MEAFGDAQTRGALADAARIAFGAGDDRQLRLAPEVLARRHLPQQRAEAALERARLRSRRRQGGAADEGLRSRRHGRRPPPLVQDDLQSRVRAVEVRDRDRSPQPGAADAIAVPARGAGRASGGTSWSSKSAVYAVLDQARRRSRRDARSPAPYLDASSRRSRTTRHFYRPVVAKNDVRIYARRRRGPRKRARRTTSFAPGTPVNELQRSGDDEPGRDPRRDVALDRRASGAKPCRPAPSGYNLRRFPQNIRLRTEPAPGLGVQLNGTSLRLRTRALGTTAGGGRRMRVFAQCAAAGILAAVVAVSGTAQRPDEGSRGDPRGGASGARRREEADGGQDLHRDRPDAPGARRQPRPDRVRGVRGAAGQVPPQGRDSGAGERSDGVGVQRRGVAAGSAAGRAARRTRGSGPGAAPLALRARPALRAVRPPGRARIRAPRAWSRSSRTSRA